jgi:hypothetical protein
MTNGIGKRGHSPKSKPTKKAARKATADKKPTPKRVAVRRA